jgi:hypothetical protein
MALAQSAFLRGRILDYGSIAIGRKSNRLDLSNGTI